MDFDKKKAVIRREIRAPEIDEYDEVKLTAIDGDTKHLVIGQYVTYKL